MKRILNDIKAEKIVSGITAATVAICTLPFFIEPQRAEASVLSSNALVSEEDTRDAGYSWERSFRNEILAQCEKLDGVRYEWGGSGSDGIDCAGSVSLVYSAALGTVWIDDPTGDYGDMTVLYYGGGAPDEYGFYWPGYAGIRSSFTNGLLSDRGIYPEENHFSEFETNGISGIQNDEWISIIRSYGIKPGDMILWWNDDNDDENAQHITIYAGIENGIPMHWTASSTSGYFCKKPLSDSSSEAGKGSFTGFMGLKATGLYEEPYVGFSLDKRDPSGMNYTGAVFSLYSDSSLSNKIGELTDLDSDGVYTDFEDLTGRSGYDDRYLLTRVSDIGPSYEDTLYIKETSYPTGVILPDGTSMSLADSNGNVPDVYRFIDDNTYEIYIEIEGTDGTYGDLEYSVKSDGSFLYSTIVSSYSYLQGSEVIVITNMDTTDSTCGRGKGAGLFSDASSLSLEKVTSTDVDVTTTVFTLTEGDNVAAVYKFSNGSWNWFDNSGRVWDTEEFPIKYDTTYKITETFSNDGSFKCADGSSIDYKVTNDSGWTKVNDNAYDFSFTTGSVHSKDTYDFTVENNRESGRFELVKQVTDEDDSCDGFEFELWDESETKLVATGVSSGNGVVYWNTGSGSNLSSFEVPSGNYVLAEIVPVKYYSDGSGEYTYLVPEGFTEGNDGKWYKTVTVETELLTESVINDRTESAIVITKESEDEVIEDVGFEICYGGKMAEPVWEDDVLDSGFTDSEGKIEFTNLPEGWYRIDEILEPVYSVSWDDGSEGKSRIVHVTSEDDNLSLEVSAYNKVDINPDIHTELVDSNGSHNISCGSMVKITDHVYFENLTAGYEYKVKGVLVNKDDGEILTDESGSEYSVSVDFFADDNLGEVSINEYGIEVVTGYVEVTFDVNTAYLFEQAFADGKESLEIVCFETITFRGIQVAEHEDIEDKAQTVSVSPEIRTYASDKETGNGVLAYSETVNIDDKVSFSGLASGESYVVTGILMDRSTGKPYVDLEGKSYEAETSFVGSSKGFVYVHFEDVKVPLDDVELVVFERLRLEESENVIAVHEDIEDADQTVGRPSCITLATTARGNKAFMKNSVVTLVDHVYYENLEPGEVYYAKATLSLSDGTEVISNGIEVTSIQEFVAEEENGVVDVTIKFDSSNLNAGQRVVVFENIYDMATDEEVAQGLNLEDVQVLSHEDLNNMDQSLTVTELPSTGEMTDWMRIGLAVSMVISGLAIITVVIEVRKRKVRRG